MKVIFLDIDGVLVTGRWFQECIQNGIQHAPRDEFGHVFDPLAVMELERIVRDMNAKIVISSTWRMQGLDMMQKMWKMRNLPGEIIDITPDLWDLNLSKNERDKLSQRERGHEIAIWMHQWGFRFNVEQFVIIDDDRDMLPEQFNNFVWTRFNTGLTPECADAAINILNRN